MVGNLTKRSHRLCVIDSSSWRPLGRKQDKNRKSMSDHAENGLNLTLIHRLYAIAQFLIRHHTFRTSP